MTKFETSSMHLDDLINVEDITDRHDELTAELEDFHDAKETTLSFEYALQDVANFEGMEDEFNELQMLTDLLAELEGLGCDHQWGGDWYPATLISESYFEQAMDELVSDCYQLPELPSFMTITLDYEALKQDYTTVEVNGVDYYCR